MGFSAAKMTRKGAPFHGATGEDNTERPTASSQAPGAVLGARLHAGKKRDEKCAGNQQRGR